jgi:hypothetical protein
MLFCLVGASLEQPLTVARGGTLAIIHSQTVSTWLGNDVSPLDSIGSRRTDAKFQEDYAMLRINDRLCYHRIRTKSRFACNFQTGFCFVDNGHIALKSSGIIAATGDAAQPVMFLGTVIARGPPWFGDQSLYLLERV